MGEFKTENPEQFKIRLAFLMEAASHAYADADSIIMRDEEEFHIIAGIYEALSQELEEGQTVDMENKISKLNERIKKFISNLGKTPDAIH